MASTPPRQQKAKRRATKPTHCMRCGRDDRGPLDDSYLCASCGGHPVVLPVATGPATRREHVQWSQTAPIQPRDADGRFTAASQPTDPDPRPSATPAPPQQEWHPHHRGLDGRVGPRGRV